MTGIITGAHKTGYDLRIEGFTYFGIINNSYRQAEKPVVNDVAFVEKREDKYIIVDIKPRRNLVSRWDFYKNKYQHFAANIDVAFIVTSANREFSTNRLRRFLSLLGNQNIKPVIVLSKIDLTDKLEVYESQIKKEFPGTLCLFVNCLEAASLEKLISCLSPNQTALLLGSSGVGKSTIINTLCGLRLKTKNSQSEKFGNKGKHATSARSMYFLDEGRCIIDIPGIRIVGVQKQMADMSFVFTKIADLALECKYTNCTHANEDNCAVQAAIQSGDLGPEILDNYREVINNRQRGKG